MKVILEFGNRGGAHTDNLIFPNAKLAIKTACAIIMTLNNDPYTIGANNGYWLLNSKHPRATWQSETHFVAVSILDGIERGCATASLWRKNTNYESLK